MQRVVRDDLPWGLIALPDLIQHLAEETDEMTMTEWGLAVWGRGGSLRDFGGKICHPRGTDEDVGKHAKPILGQTFNVSYLSLDGRHTSRKQSRRKLFSWIESILPPWSGQQQNLLERLWCVLNEGIIINST
ncbi:hypothetical protein CDAR_77631 [Caerostris darwini]|uniref:Uncharacterized protein n=1 Tax=Caerostris darwini TaxID=1538125 RepID=A0AAV4V421_9ARAC|nr:hypothetical protein CDAR_77631 [Caerostris darwini]